jgi:alcohol dehydrogenase class IV
MCHALGGAYDLPHAELHTVVLPHVVAFNAAAIPAEMDRVARALDAADPAAALFDLGRNLGAPAGLKDIGLPDTALTQAVAVVLEKDLADNPRTADAPAMHALLEDALAGTRPTVG